MKEFRTKLSHRILVLLLLGSCASAFGHLQGKPRSESIDSTGIAIFFSPKNLPNITDHSKDSIRQMVGKNLTLTDLYFYHEARLKLETGQFDEAMNLTQLRLKNFPAKLPKFAKAKYFNIIGSVHATKKETKRAITFFEKALRLSENENEPVYAAMMENNIANMYFTLVDYPSAYLHVAKGYETFKNHPEHPFYGKILAVLSISEAKIGKFSEAKTHGELALKSGKLKNDLIVLIVSKLALGEVAISEKNFEKAKEYCNASLELSEKYGQTPFIVLNSISLLVANLETKNYLEAVQFGEKALNLVNQGGDQSTVYSIKKYLAAAYFGTNQAVKAYTLMNESHEIFREVNNIENKKAINDILLKYDSEKKEKDLIASNNKLLQKDIERKNLMSILGFVGLIAIILLLIIFLINRRNKARIALINAKQEKKVMQAVFDGEEFERERISRELHDGVASNLTAVRYQLMANDNIPIADKTQLEKIILQAHEDTRRLSHNLTPISFEKFGFEKALTQFAAENSREGCTVFSALIPTGSTIPQDKALIIYRVAQELTQNAIKHADATEISIQVIVDGELSLIVEDDGKGFDFEQKKDSNGMASVNKRAIELNGTFSVDSSENHGTVVKFTIS